MKPKIIISSIFVIWLAVILTAFFIVQKPAMMTVAGGLAFLIATLLYDIVFVSAAAGLGYFIVSYLNFEILPTQRLILSTGFGLGLLGLLGFGLAVIGFAHGWFLLVLLVGILVWSGWRGYLSLAWNDLHNLWTELTVSSHSAPAWIRWFALAELLFAFLLSLAPPVEAFDGLSYHLVVPSWWLRDGGLQLVNLPPYWYPSLVEGMFVWPLSLRLETTPQFIHLIFGVLAVLLIWDWSRLLFGRRAGWWSIAIFISMPSLPWLASWAYNDLGLIFYSLSVLLAVSRWKDSTSDPWLLLSGVLTGFALGTKYTSFILPITILLLLIWWGWNNKSRLVSSVVKYVSMGTVFGIPWYLRNWIWTGNPVYPFVFGGPFWDSFRAAWFAGIGSGIGWNILQIFSLPFVTTLGYRDVSYFDGRIGPFYLVLLPVLFWVTWKVWKNQSREKDALAILLLFSSLNIAFWTFSVIQTIHLFQARLVWPGLIPLLPLMAAGILQLEAMDTSKLRISFILSVVIGLTIFIFLLDFGLSVMVRNPIRAAIGSEPRMAYTARLQPKYAQALALVNQTPLDAYIYLLNEPRSYGMSRRVQPDLINDNLPHDFHIYATNTEVIDAWRMLGYTHVLAAKDIFEPDNSKINALVPEYRTRLDELTNLLIEMRRSTEGDYILFAIPPE